jgi:predicted glycoside hydrolase/deacetylase ChbG (UPF0249 family)
MTNPKSLIVNADDFGQSPGINAGIIQCHERGIVTSASLMVRWPAAAAACEYARNHSRLSVGLHVDLGEWICRNDEWFPLYQVVTQESQAAVREEVSRQLKMFQEFMGRDPTHLDSHQHVHLHDPLKSIVREIGAHHRIPVRHFSAIRYCGDFYGQLSDGSTYPDGVSIDRLIQLLSELPEGVTELSCHPGLDDDVDSMYRSERSLEVKALCDPAVRDCLRSQGLLSRSFHSELERLTVPSTSSEKS